MAVPLLSMIVILVEELWVKPLEESTVTTANEGACGARRRDGRGGRRRARYESLITAITIEAITQTTITICM